MAVKTLSLPISPFLSHPLPFFFLTIINESGPSCFSLGSLIANVHLRWHNRAKIRTDKLLRSFPETPVHPRPPNQTAVLTCCNKYPKTWILWPGCYPEDPIKEPSTESVFAFSDFPIFHLIFLQLNLANAEADERKRICSACQSFMPPHPLLILMSGVDAEMQEITADRALAECHKLGAILLFCIAFFFSWLRITF